MMDKNTLYRFFMGTASFKEEEDVYHWVNNSEKNKAEFLKERKTFDLLLLHPEKSGTQYKTSTINLWTFTKIAAAIVILVVSSTFLYINISKDNTYTAIQDNKIIVPTGQCVNLVLSDGTKVWLNSRTEMTYPAAFTKDARKVKLNGEGYFEVTKDKKHPFIVETNKCDIEVLGTKFNVEAYNERKDFSTALMEGSLRVKDKVNPARSVLLYPKQKVDWHQGIFNVDSIQNYDTYRWKEGLICFENMAFPDLMKKIEKCYGFRIVIENNNMNSYICSGKFRMSDGIDFILRVLQRNRNFSFTRNEEQSVIHIK